MDLPLCVKVDHDTAALVLDGWRIIGQLVTYAGYSGRGTDDGSVKLVDELPMSLLAEMSFNGRFMRDTTINPDDIPPFVLQENDSCTVTGTGPAAVLVVSYPRIILIGVHPMARGLGLAKKLIREAFQDRIVVASTYSDNQAAIGLYKSLHMTPIMSQWVLHK